MSRQRVLVLGANGRIGLAAAQAFDAAGWEVLAQTRRPFEAGMPAAARRVDADLHDTDGIASAAAGTSAVVYAVNPLYTRWRELAVPMARAGMDAAQRLDALFMLPGNVYNFGASMPPLLVEDTPQRPSTEKGRLRRAIEDEMAARDGLRSVVLRAGDFFGAGAGSWMDVAIVKSLRAGRLVYPGPLDVVHAWTYVPDLARAFVSLAAHGGLPRVARYHFPGHNVTGAELLSAIEREARALGVVSRPVRTGAFPWMALRALAWAVPMWREILDMRYLWEVPHALDGTCLAQALGSVKVTPLDEAVRGSLLALGYAPAPAMA